MSEGSEGSVLDASVLDAVSRLVERASRGGGPLLVASDFDGVLAPLVDDPMASRPTARAAVALDRLARLEPGRVRVALVSGRDLETLAQLSAPPAGTLLVGSHGAERGEVAPATGDDEGRAVTRLPFALTDEQAQQLREVTDGLEAVAGPVEGAWVEHKPSAAVLHTRLADPHAADAAAERAAALGESLGAHVMRGKGVVEIAVVETSKGHAIAALREELGASAAFYMGDDVTDERAFAVLRAHDLSVKVGAGETVATHRVAGTDAAALVLVALADALEAVAAPDAAL